MPTISLQIDVPELVLEGALAGSEVTVSVKIKRATVLGAGANVDAGADAGPEPPSCKESVGLGDHDVLVVFGSKAKYLGKPFAVVPIKYAMWVRSHIRCISVANRSNALRLVRFSGLTPRDQDLEEEKQRLATLSEQ